MSELDDIRGLNLDDVFAEGGMGRIHRATDTTLAREVAAKVLKREHLDQCEVVERFLDEARLAASLEHPNVIPIHALGVREGVGPFFTMKLVEGETLFDRLETSRGTPQGDLLSEIIDILIQVCDALSFAHSRDVVHADLKSRNILLGAFHQVYLTDWGNARRIGAPAPVSSDGRPLVLGTLGMLAPEQARAEPLDARTDVFGIGALLYTILARRVPFSRGGPEARIDAAREGRYRPLDRMAPRASVTLRRICARAMAHDPADRYPTIEALRNDLDAYRRVRIDPPTRTLVAGQVLIQEGDASDCLYIVRSGEFVVTQGQAEIERCGPGVVLGEVGVLTQQPRSATVMAVTEAVVEVLDPHVLTQELGRAAPWMRAVVMNLAARLHGRRPS